MQYLNLIAESRYLEKKKPSRLLKEATSQTDFYCASNVGEYKIYSGVSSIRNLKAHDGTNGYEYYQSYVFLIDTDGERIAEGNFPGWKKDERGFFSRYWYCKCEGGKCKVATSDVEKEHECKVPQGQACETKEGTTTGNQQGTTPGGQTGGDCSKGPMDLAVSMGLNWKETKQKWIDAKCNGTTPCVLGDGATNINIRNALCKGTWNPKDTGSQEIKPGGSQEIKPGTDGESKFIEPTFGQTPKAD